MNAHTWVIVVGGTIFTCTWFFGGIYLLLQIIKGLTGWDILAELWRDG